MEFLVLLGSPVGDTSRGGPIETCCGPIVWIGGNDKLMFRNEREERTRKGEKKVKKGLGDEPASAAGA